MPTQKKIDIVNTLKQGFEKAQAYIFVDYRGLTVASLSDLRNSIEKIGGALTVAKNTLIEKSVNIKNEGPTAVLFAYKEPFAAIKALSEFAKNNPIIKIKNGFFEGRTFSGEELLSIAKLPTREVLIGKIAGGLKSPLYRLASVLSGNQRKLVIVLSEIAKKRS